VLRAVPQRQRGDGAAAASLPGQIGGTSVLVAISGDDNQADVGVVGLSEDDFCRKRPIRCLVIPLLLKCTRPG
jgi:hypothetical protein